ncbi:MAG: FRG domain-containing protein [Deltaproteobacteria bacterium]|nr:FRG domain-containing protein [Deltaproteobacteria bacterium]
MSEDVTLKTDKLTEFLRVVEDWRDHWKVGERAVYRGHTDFNWILVAKLFRDPDADSENHVSDDQKQADEQLLRERLRIEEAHDLEHRLLNDFSRYLYAHRPDLVCTVPEEEKSSIRAMQEWRQLALAQHYGLPTRFLDFTTNMLVALFFAVEERAARRKTSDGKLQDQDSAVWAIEVPNRLKVWQVWKKEGIWLSPLEFAKERSDPPIANFMDTAFVPEHIDERIRAQGSVFMCEPWGKKPDWQLHLRLRNKTKTIKEKTTQTLRIRIPRDYRESLREQLDLAGINRATLFPDLGSAARYLAWAVHQRKRPYNR